MKVLALIGSPRKRGNSDILADHVLKGAREAGAEVSKIYLDDHFIRPIAEVADNSKQREDVRADDDLPKILQIFLQADIIIWSTPVYWAGVSAQMKCFIDRLSSYFNHPAYTGQFHGKGHIVLCTYGRDDIRYSEYITEPMKTTIKTLRGDYLGDICVPGCYGKGKILQKLEILDQAVELGRTIVNKIFK